LPTAQNLHSASRGGKKIKSQSKSEATYRSACLRGSFACDVSGRLPGCHREQAREDGIKAGGRSTLENAGG
jgi:hypothetical protein